MAEGLKPESPTPEAFTRLFNDCCKATTLSMPKIAKESHTSTTALTAMRAGKFAQNAEKLVSKRAISGSAKTLFRICDYFKLDFEACLKACGLPTKLSEDTDTMERFEDGNKRRVFVSRGTYITPEATKKFNAVIEATGQIDFDLALQILVNLCEKDSAVKGGGK